MKHSRTARFAALLLVAAALLGLSARQALAEGTTKVKGKVLDNNGKPMPNVDVHFEAADIKKVFGPVRTNKNGEYFVGTLDITVAKKWHVFPKVAGYKVLTISYEIVDSTGDVRGKDDDHLLDMKQDIPEFPFALVGDYGRNVVDFVMAKDAEFAAAQQAVVKKRKAAKGEVDTAAETPAAPDANAAGPKLTPEQKESLQKAQQLASAGNHAQAIELYRAYLAKDPTGLPTVYFYLGKSLYETGDDAAAKQAFAKAVELQPTMIRAHYFLGSLALRADDGAGAAAEFENELKVSPDSDTVLYALGQAYFKAGEPDKALAALDRAATVSPGKPETYMLMANIYGQKGDKANEDAMYKKVAEIDPGKAAVMFFNAGVKAWNENRGKEAVTAYKKSLEVDPSYAQAHRELGRALMAQQDFKGALEHFQEYLKLQPQAPDAKEIQDSIALLKK